ncbi:hypothetical protein DM785_17405 (plasmid) [Deinococcus actinosclerus]|nr:hypothetical protein DM785_17405 [Deinococcus actinosclerus]
MSERRWGPAGQASPPPGAGWGRRAGPVAPAWPPARGTPPRRTPPPRSGGRDARAPSRRP